METFWTVWFLGGAAVFMALPLLLFVHIWLVVKDFRRFRSWWSAAAAIAWAVTALGAVMAMEVNLAPPMFGIPLICLALTAWNTRTAVVVLGAAAFDILGTIVVLRGSAAGAELNWALIPLGPLTLVLVIGWHLWRTGRAFSWGWGRSPTAA